MRDHGEEMQRMDGLEGGADRQEERLRRLFEAANPCAEPVGDPPVELSRRVAELAAGQRARFSARRWWGARSVVWAPAAVLAGAVIVLGGVFLSLTRREASPARRPAPSIVTQPLSDSPSTGGNPKRTPIGSVTEPQAAPRIAREEERRGVRFGVRPRENSPDLPPRQVAPPQATDDLAVLNGDPLRDVQQWIVLPRDAEVALEERLRRTVQVGDDFIHVPLPRIADADGRVIAAAIEGYKREAAVVDARLAREVTVQKKATALSDLCDHLRAETGIYLTAGSSVADDKVTLFCRAMPLRDVMRQLSRPFGFTWTRTRRDDAYRYELVQDLRSQLLEEELRNRNRHAALLALEREIDRYRPLLHLSPDAALALVEKAPEAERPLLRRLAGRGWGPLQTYVQLSARDLAALRDGQELQFSEAPRPGEQPQRAADVAGAPLPSEVGRGVLQSMREWRLVRRGIGYEYAADGSVPGALPPVAVPQARGLVRLRIIQSEPGRFALRGTSGLFTIGDGGEVYYTGSGSGDIASGVSPAVMTPDNAAANASLSGDPSLRSRVTLLPEGRPRASALVSRPGSGSGSERDTGRVTPADVLEALHRATGKPIVADSYTRLYTPDAVSVRNTSLYQALNRLSDAMRLRWKKEGEWLQFRSTSFFYDRLKEVPNRLLSRWVEARRVHGALRLEDLVEIAGLSDAQLDAGEMAEGAREYLGLAEWDLVRRDLRPHLRFLAGFTPDQRREALAPAGLAFSRMPLAQQQQFLTFALDGRPLESLEALSGAAFRVDYSVPGEYQWGEPGWSGFYTRWVVPLAPGPEGRRVPRPSVRARRRAEALAAVQRVDPSLRATLLDAVRRVDPRVTANLHQFDEEQISPTQMDLTFVYIPGNTNRLAIRVQTRGTSGSCHYQQR